MLSKLEVGYSKPNQLIKDLKAHDIEEISQSGFQAFSEAYKSAREVFEQAVENRQRKIVSNYANQLKELLKRIDGVENTNSLLKDLEKIRLGSNRSITSRANLLAAIIPNFDAIKSSAKF